MKAKLIFLCLAMALLASHAQITDNNYGTNVLQLSPLSAEEMSALRSLPTLSLPQSHKSKSLPAVVDNSVQPYMREVFQQSGLSCGQAAGIAYNYTYEIDRMRGLPANDNDNLYPTHFTWNWMHGGSGWYGVSYLHSFEVLRHCGNVNVTDYGGSLAYGGYERWMSGYQNYKRGMENRINRVYQINVGTPEGLDVFKHWIHDHHESGSVGGVGSFYSQYMAATFTLPPGTPEEGKYVLTSFGGSANHAQTIVGYNDSIRWDYNGDGQYTNHLDINNDGEVNMKDWEIGGFKMVQSYGGVPNWGDQGYAYMMYKTVADKLGQGGIWNHCVHVLDVKEECHPQATMKVTLTHDTRNMLKVVAGVSNNPGSNNPQYVLEFPIFNYQGGPQFMQGGSSNPDNKTIEFGLDISPLLSVIDLNAGVKFFLQVFENDPASIGWGHVNSMSAFDYTNGTTEYQSSQYNEPIVNNGVTTVSLVADFDFDRVNISTPALPAATVGQAYSFQLTAEGGEAPYHFSLLKHYEESAAVQNFPGITAEQLVPADNSKGFVTKALDFDFPFYDSSYSSVTVHVDGYLMFDEQLYPYPYFVDDMVMFRITRHISPFMCHAIRLYPSENDGMWYEGDSTYATFRWKASIEGISSAEMNFCLTLYPSGDFEFYYGDMNLNDDILWIAGICDGNEDELQFAGIYPDQLPTPNSKYSYARYDYPGELSLSPEGILSGTVTQTVNSSPMTFRVTDNNFIYSTRTLIFATTGISVTDSISSGDDDKIEYGETVKQSVTLTNLESVPVSGATMTIFINDTNITMIDDYEYIGSLGVGESVTFTDAFSFIAASDIPDGHIIEIETSIEATKQFWENTLIHEAYAAVPEIETMIIDDGNNGYLDPGESCNLITGIHNTGGSAGTNISCLLETSDPYIVIDQGQAFISELYPDSIKVLIFGLSVDSNAPLGHIASFSINMQGDRGFEASLPFELNIGLTSEDFETGDFSLFTWGFKGNRNWKIDTEHKFEGNYSARSGNIFHEQQSSMILDIDVLTPGDISFYRMVSCENAANDNYDYLSFLVDGTEVGRWDSIISWAPVSFPLTEGYHRLEWRYTKDSTVSAGLDAAFIDLITLPGCLDANPHLETVPVVINKAMLPGSTDIDTLILINPVDGDIDFNIILAEPTDAPDNISGSYLECDQSNFFSGEEFEWDFTLFNNSDDNEWLQELTIQFPPGAVVESTTNFTGGSGGDLVFEGDFGNGPLMKWYGEDASGWGTVHGGEYAYGTIRGYMESGFAGNLLMDYVITGDIYGTEPHVVEGQIELHNLGGQVSWLSCDTYAGNVPGLDNKMIMLTFDASGLDDGEYYCEILLSDNFQHETVIPVHLLVDTYLGTDDGNDKNTSPAVIYPNPFTDMFSINFTMEEDNRINIRLASQEGKILSVLAENMPARAGTHEFRWTKREDTAIHTGIYFLIIDKGYATEVIKVIKM